MKAGFSKQCVTPPLGTRMMGFGARDVLHGCDSIRDDIFVRALYVEHQDQEALVLSFDLCFLGRADSDRIKGALGARLNLLPRQILVNASHSHTSPAVGTWGFHHYLDADRLYLDELCAQTVQCAIHAKRAARPATLDVASGQSTIPMNRRKPCADGTIQNRPNPHGIVCDALPVCRVKDESGRDIAVLFSISAHPSICGGFAISAEYPGVATRSLAEYLKTDCAMFLQGCGGDAKTRPAGENSEVWRSDDWSIVNKVGLTLADEVIAILERPMQRILPSISSAIIEMNWPLKKPPSREVLLSETRIGKTRDELFAEGNMRALWARRMIELLDRRKHMQTSAPVLLQKLSLGKRLRLVAIEGEPVAEHGLTVLRANPDGVTFPLGYSNGEALYLPCDRQLPEGGYEVTSFWEYGFLSQLDEGIDTALRQSLDAANLREQS